MILRSNRRFWCFDWSRIGLLFAWLTRDNRYRLGGRFVQRNQDERDLDGRAFFRVDGDDGVFETLKGCPEFVTSGRSKDVEIRGRCAHGLEFSVNRDLGADVGKLDTDSTHEGTRAIECNFDLLKLGRWNGAAVDDGAEQMGGSLCGSTSREGDESKAPLDSCVIVEFQRTRVRAHGVGITPGKTREVPLSHEFIERGLVGRGIVGVHDARDAERGEEQGEREETTHEGQGYP